MDHQEEQNFAALQSAKQESERDQAEKAARTADEQRLHQKVGDNTFNQYR